MTAPFNRTRSQLVEGALGKVAKKWRIKATAALLVAASSGCVLTPCANASQPSAPSAQSVGLGGHRLQQVALTTRDLDRAIVFYRDVLGLPLIFVTNNMAFFDVAGTRLMIALDPERPDARTTSIVYFDAPRFHATVEQLAALGVRLEAGLKSCSIVKRAT